MQNNEAKTSNTVESTGQAAGRGFIVISLAKAWFMVGGASITFGLPFVFSWYAQDGRELYGRYYDINNTLNEDNFTATHVQLRQRSPSR